MIALLSMALAQSPVEEVQMAELDRVRGQVADQIHLAAFDLIDELVWGMNNEPVFEDTTPVVLAGVTVPVGLGTGMGALVENHIADVLSDNPQSNIQLVHCPQCTAVVVQSGPEATVVSRGLDNPAVLEEVGGTSTGKHALFIDVEAEGAWLVLRARITKLTPDLPIVWSHTLATSASTPSMLRESDDLKSVSDARKEYLGALKGGRNVTVPLRIAVRSYARPPDGNQGIAPPPFLWLQSGVEFAATDARDWTGSIIAGYSFIPQAYQGLMGQVRVSRLITGRARSLTRPDLYGFIGGSAITVWGPATAPFGTDPVTADDIISGINLEGPRTSFGAFQVGLEMRIGNRFGFTGFLETLPERQSSPNLGNYVFVLTGWQSIGTEVTVCF